MSLSAYTNTHMHWHIGCCESNTSHLFPWKLQQIQRTQKHYLIEKILSTIFQHSHHQELCIFASNEEEPACWACKNLHGHLECGLSFMLRSPLLKCITHPPLHSVHIHCLVSINAQQALMNISECHFFPTWRNLMTHLCLIRASMSETILSDCPSAVICHTATKCSGILASMFDTYCHTTNICLWYLGPIL